MLEVIAIVASDIHLSSQVPSARSAEPDWLKAMQRSTDQLKALGEKYNAPIIIAGDIWDRWNEKPEVINWAIDNFPPFWGIAGQHDLPNHRYNERHRSAYGTLIRAGILSELDPYEPTLIGDNLVVWAFPWGVDLYPCPDLTRYGNRIRVAVIHRYIWKEGHGHLHAPEEKRANQYRESLKGYHAAVFGDNHSSFILGKPGGQMVMNCGTFFRRKADEVYYRPQVGLLFDDGSIQAHYLDTSQDLFVEEITTRLDVDENDPNAASSDEFLESIRALGADTLDFRDVVRRYLDAAETDESVRGLVLAAIE